MKLFYSFALLLFLSCNNKSTSPDTSTSPDSTQKAKDFFPVADYIRSEIRDVDSLPVGIIKYTTQNGKTDSIYIKLEEFHQLAAEFLPPLLSKETFENEFTETSFFDKTTQYANFLYASNRKDLPLRRVDVLAKPADVVYNKVKSIYMEKFMEKPDTSVIQKLYWKAGKNFQINTEIHTRNNTVAARQVKVVWNTGE